MACPRAIRGGLHHVERLPRVTRGRLTPSGCHVLTGNVKWAVSSLQTKSLLHFSPRKRRGRGQREAEQRVEMSSCKRQASRCQCIYRCRLCRGRGRRQPNTRCLSALTATVWTAQNTWRNPKNALHMLGHGPKRPGKINNCNISEGVFIFVPDSGPNFTFSGDSNHNSIYFLLLPLVFPLNFVCIFFSHYTTRITISNLLIWGYKNCVTVQAGFTMLSECCLLGG